MLHSHLDLALRHLGSAAVLAEPLESPSALGAADRLELSEIAADLGILIDQLAATIVGSSLEAELTRLLDDVERPVE